MSWRRASACEAGLEPLRGVLERHVGRRGRRGRGRPSPVRRTASPCRRRRTATSGPRRRRRCSPARRDVDRDGADALRAVEHERDAESRRAAGRPARRSPSRRASSDQRGVGGDVVGERGQRPAAHASRRARGRPAAGPSRPGCSASEVRISSPGPSPARRAPCRGPRWSRWSARRPRTRAQPSTRGVERAQLRARSRVRACEVRRRGGPRRAPLSSDVAGAPRPRPGQRPVATPRSGTAMRSQHGEARRGARRRPSREHYDPPPDARRLPDGSQQELADGATGADLAADIGAGLARAALAVKVDGEVRDLGRALPDGATVRSSPTAPTESLDLIRHDTAHVLAAAVHGPLSRREDLHRPADRERLLLRLRVPRRASRSPTPTSRRSRPRWPSTSPPTRSSTREDVTPPQARERFVRRGPALQGRADRRPRRRRRVSLYTNGPFTDLCRGPHAPSTKRIKAFKLLSTAGAYWRGDSDRTMLTRIYGTAFHSKKDLEAHLERARAGARARPPPARPAARPVHVLASSAPARAFWLPKGTTVFNTLVERSREMTLARGYDEVKTPLLYDARCGRPPATGASTARTCSRWSTRTGRWASSR